MTVSSYNNLRKWVKLVLPFYLFAFLILSPALAAKKQQQPEVSVCDLRTERLVNPMSIDTPTPRLGVMQVQYRIIVSSTVEKAAALEGDLWDSAFGSDQSQWVVYQGKPLKSNTHCYWRVKVLTTQGTSDWSEVAMWNVGLLTESDTADSRHATCARSLRSTRPSGKPRYTSVAWECMRSLSMVSG